VARVCGAHAHKSSAGADKRVYRPATLSSVRVGKGNVGPRLARALRSARHEHPSRRSPPGPGAGNGSALWAGGCASSSQDLTAAPARRDGCRGGAMTEHDEGTRAGDCDGARAAGVPSRGVLGSVPCGRCRSQKTQRPRRFLPFFISARSTPFWSAAMRSRASSGPIIA